ncbi:hypothetical protein BDV28DRAFT_164924 [Aspergillus coremiiformis]|uniref:Rhodopsin domain-containing protein n=1 Tax=Aspergillus coremiiformis TaxID=138285 RepID=A0A5N6ZBP4_9EURO|nr:hypothetical protein BDV28DRAFT_164924 [Aspergillus coremiiformis]
MDPFSRSLTIESWTLYVIGKVAIYRRITYLVASRRIAQKSWKKLQIDDYLMMVTLVTFTGVIVCVNETAEHGSNYIPLDKATALTPEQHEDAIYGSKMTFIMEQFTLASLWLVKACLLSIYNRLTLGLREHLAVKVLAVYVATTFVIIELLLLLVWCGPPVTMYWEVPARDSQCATYYHHLILTSTFNISSDLMMLCIPIPLIIRSRISLQRKFILCGVFSLGLVVRWYVAEVSTAVYVANVPLLWPLLREVFNLSSFVSSYGRQGASERFTPRNRLSWFRSRLSRMDDSTEMIVPPPQSDLEKGVARPFDRGLELSPIPARHYQATVTTEDRDQPVKEPLSPRTIDSQSGIFRTVELMQSREVVLLHPS